MFQDEWKLIYEQFYRPLYLYALSLTGNRQDAEDILQETFVKAFLSYENKGSINYWLIVVLKNEFLQLQRKRKREVLNAEMNVETNKMENICIAKQDILTDFINQEERKQIFREIQNLPLNMKEILIESVYFQMSDNEIAKLHNITNENVRKIRSRAKQKLIEKMKEGK